jgi:hypothetical protein
LVTTPADVREYWLRLDPKHVAKSVTPENDRRGREADSRRQSWLLFKASDTTFFDCPLAPTKATSNEDPKQLENNAAPEPDPLPSRPESSDKSCSLVAAESSTALATDTFMAARTQTVDAIESRMFPPGAGSGHSAVNYRRG